MIDEIERLSRRRQGLWLSVAPSDGSHEVKRIASRLADLYEQKRHEAAQSTSVRRTEIVKRARVESELERMMSDKAR